MFRSTCVAAALAALALAASAQGGAPNVTARAFLVENPVTGEVLAQHGAWARVPIASITKLMTVVVALEHAKWNDVVRVRSAAARVGESTVNLRAGEQITVGDLVKAALIQSANDAADALADYVGKGDQSAFVAMMIRDLAPYAWHFTDHKDVLGWLDQLASKGEANTPDVKALKNALKGIEKYNKDRGF